MFTNKIMNSADNKNFDHTASSKTPKKIVRLSTSLKKNRRSLDKIAQQITTPIIKDDEEKQIKKLIEPMQKENSEDWSDDSKSSKSRTPSPKKQSGCLDQYENLSVVNAETTFKILVIGDSTVGKTSFVQRYIQNKHNGQYRSTVGVDFSSKLINNDKYNQPIRLQIWDIAGQDRYICLTRVYYKNAHGCIIMFDLTNKKSFENIIQWKNDLDSKCISEDGAMLPCLLLASKCDLLKHRQIEINEIEKICNQCNFIGWIEISSQTHLMIEDSINFLIDNIINSKFMSLKKGYNSPMSQITERNTNRLNQNIQLLLKERSVEEDKCIDNENYNGGYSYYCSC